MNAIIYEGTWQHKQFICSAFENRKEFVNILHEPSGIFQQYWQQGQVIYSSKTGNVAAKAQADFEAKNLHVSHFKVGHVVQHVWRPGLCIDIPEALDIQEDDQNRTQKSIRILVDKLNDILLYIEPDQNALKIHGHKIRELLILSCTEVESFWQSYLRLAGNAIHRPSTNDYVKLKTPLSLADYKVILKSHPFTVSYKPFFDWDLNNPTTSLDWYSAYNQTKHDKNINFSKATLEHCIKAIMATIVMYCVRYSPYGIISGDGISAKIIAEIFSVELEPISIATFYIPAIESVQMASGAFSAPLASKFESPWEIDPFCL